MPRQSPCPRFMETFMKFDLSSNGAISAAPSLLLAALSIFTGRLFTFLHVEKKISKTRLRKSFNFFSNFVPAFLLLASVLIPFEQRTAAVVCLVLGIGLTACVFTGGPFSGAADIGPQYTGTIFSMAACVGNVPGFAIPPLLAAMTPEDTRNEWLRFVSISVALHLFSSIYLSLFWKSDIQPFAKTQPNDPVKSQLKEEVEEDAV
ncbi:sialin-like [Pollicipes pollicipes]|uniref:sialin-like n=1 Tax=Pollicipes pollicipes TaxID=41117 RepID=UPI001884AB25|nr:sialin-like [Pollicipes pollicipes]